MHFDLVGTLSNDNDLRRFVRTTIGFAVRFWEPPIHETRVRLEQIAPEGDARAVHCSIEAASRAGRAWAEATGPDVCTAVQEAADRLEVSLSRAHRTAPRSSNPIAA